LRSGSYYIALALYSTNTPSTGSITATFERASIAPTVSAARNLASGVATPYSLPASDRPTLYTSDYGFRITVPPGSARLEVTLRTETSNTDVDLFLRYGAEPELAEGRIVADYRSTSDTGDEYLIVQPVTVPPLRPGVYFIALGVYSTGVPAQGTITASVTPDKYEALTALEPKLPATGDPISRKPGFKLAVPVPPESKLDQEEPGRLRKSKLRNYRILR
jgi:hypothetical protein